MLRSIRLRELERADVPTARGGRFWHAKAIREYIREDVYKPYTHAEIRALVDAGQMAASVAALLDPRRCYGIWWFNRRRTKTMQVAEARKDGGRTYKKKNSCIERPKEEWIAVPVPDSGIPREWVDAAREAIKANGKISNAGHRVWERTQSMGAIGGHYRMRHLWVEYDDSKCLSTALSGAGETLLLSLPQA
jgi:site-specific DNA recombinase